MFWILLSVAVAAGDGAAPLEEIVGTADAINHAVPTGDELTSLISALIRNDLILVENPRYSLTSKGHEICNLAGAAQGTPWMVQLREIASQLAPDIVMQLQVRFNPDRLGIEEADSAIRAYLSRSKALLAEATTAAIQATQARLLEQARTPTLERRFMSWLSKFVDRHR